MHNKVFDMKKLLFIAAMLMSYTVLTSSSCNHNDNNPTPANTTTPGPGWRVSAFTEPGEDKTGDYTGYVFDFASGGALTAVRNGQTTSGTWEQSSSNGVPGFEISLSTSDNKLSKLNHRWVLVNKTDVLIDLRDDNVSSYEMLKFSK
jgi:hypothetical protein